jgi:hypothetical protein
MTHANHARLQSRPAVPSLAAYDRRTELSRILPLWPGEIDDDGPRGRRMILARLRRALRAERRRGISGHWTYDLARHVELLRVYRLELARYRALRRRRLAGCSQHRRHAAVHRQLGAGDV